MKKLAEKAVYEENRNKENENEKYDKTDERDVVEEKHRYYRKYRQEKRAEMPCQKADAIRNKDRKRKRKPMKEHKDITSTTT